MIFGLQAVEICSGAVYTGYPTQYVHILAEPASSTAAMVTEHASCADLRDETPGCGFSGTMAIRRQ